MTSRPSPCRAPPSQGGSALLLALIFMAVLARMALSAVDSALLGTALALNYRDHDRVFQGAEAFLMATDAALLARIQREGLSMTLDSLSASALWMETEAALWPAEEGGPLSLRYRMTAGQFSVGSTADPAPVVPACWTLYHIDVQASGVKAGTHVELGLQRQACCASAPACEDGDFVALNRVWRQHR